MTERFKIATIVGARPQFVKAAALSPALGRTGRFTELLVHTGQHFDSQMSDVFFAEMAIPAPFANLGIGGGSHGENTGRMLEAIEKVLLRARPDAVVVFGDTDSTLAAAIATAKTGILLAHIEAGLRSYRRSMPEEINRVLTDHASDVLYAPSESAVATLRGEGLPAERIVLAGDVMFDVVRRFAEEAERASDVLLTVGLEPAGYHVLTLHRKENTDDPDRLARILRGLAASPVPIVFPVHPRTRNRLAAAGLALPESVRAVEPLGYRDTLQLVRNARVVLTDSGGLQKEAFFLGRPCATLRDETEWTELVVAGANVLVGADADAIARIVRGDAWPVTPHGVYGNGDAADRIAVDLLARLERAATTG